MKVKKSQLRALLKPIVRECVREMLLDDPELVEGVIREHVVSLLGESVSRGRAKSQVRKQRVGRAARGTNIPAAVKRGPSGAQRGRTQRRPDFGDASFDDLVSDTIENTVGEQIAEDRKLESVMNFEGMDNIEEGPATRLAEAATQPNTNPLAAQRAAQLQQRVDVQQLTQPPTPQPAGPQFTDADVPSQEQLERKFRQANAEQGDTSGDLTSLGIDPARWAAGADDVGNTQGVDVADLSAIAAEMNAGL